MKAPRIHLISMMLISTCIACSGGSQNHQVAPTSSTWTSLNIPLETQASQMDAGYKNGCEITAMVYALKFGPADYQKAYAAIPGKTDVDKIRWTAKKFSSVKSRDQVSQPAFSEKYGTNPNDLPWMFQGLLRSSTKLTTTTFLNPVDRKMPRDKTMLDELREKAMASLGAGKPIITQLIFTEPDFSHAVLIMAIENQSTADGTLTLQIFDPMTGKVSMADIRSGNGKISDQEFEGLSFSDANVVSRDGFLLSISL